MELKEEVRENEVLQTERNPEQMVDLVILKVFRLFFEGLAFLKRIYEIFCHERCKCDFP